MPACADTQHRIGFIPVQHSENYRPRQGLANDRPIFGGADRDRTGGLLVANQALSQLSYSPMPYSQLETNNSPLGGPG